MSKILSTNKIFDLLRQFEKPTLLQFLKFVSSPFFNESKTLTALFFEFERLVRTGKSGFQKEVVWAKIFHGKPFDDALFRRFNANLMVLAEQFLAEKALSVKPTLASLLAYEQYEKEHLSMNDMLFLKTQNDIRVYYKQQASNEFLDLFQLQKINYRTLKFDNERLIKYPVHLLTNQLDNYYFTEKLRFFCINITTSKKNEELEFIQPILDQIKSNYDSYPPILQWFYLASVSLKNQDDETTFLKFKNAIIENPLTVEINDCSMLFEFAMNYSILKVNKGRSDFFEHYLDIVSAALKSEIITHGGQIVPWHFNNIVAIALRQDKAIWAEEFVEKYKAYLSSEFRENVVQFSISRILWHKKDYDKITQLLRDVEFEDINYGLITKSTLMKAYFELDEIEALSSFLDSFRVYINRHKEISAQRRTNYLFLIKFVKKLSKTILGDTKAVQKLREELTNTKDVLSIDWLFEKLTQLEGKPKK